MDRLVYLLKEVETSDIKPMDYLEEKHHSAIPLIKGLLCDVLITEGGNLNWDAKDDLYRAGYECFPVEQDRWGWVIGAVWTEKGSITFG